MKYLKTFKESIGFKLQDPKCDYEVNFATSDPEIDHTEDIKKELNDMNIKWISVKKNIAGYSIHALFYDENDADKMSDDLTYKMISKYKCTISDVTGHEYWG